MRSQRSKISPLLKRCELSDFRLIWGSREKRDATAMKGEDGNLGVVSCSPVKHQQQGEMLLPLFRPVQSLLQPILVIDHFYGCSLTRAWLLQLLSQTQGTSELLITSISISEAQHSQFLWFIFSCIISQGIMWEHIEEASINTYTNLCFLLYMQFIFINTSGNTKLPI